MKYPGSRLDVVLVWLLGENLGVRGGKRVKGRFKVMRV